MRDIFPFTSTPFPFPTLFKFAKASAHIAAPVIFVAVLFVVFAPKGKRQPV